MHYTIDRDFNHPDKRELRQHKLSEICYAPGHSLGGGWTRHIVELREGDTADNPADNGFLISQVGVVVYDCAPEGGERAVIYDTAKDFYASLFNAPPIEQMHAVVDYCWNSEEADYERMKDEGEEVTGHVFEHLRVIAFWLAGNK